MLKQNDPAIVTKRLVLRAWRPEDFEPFAQMNADPRVREYFPSVLSAEESNQEAMRHASSVAEQGWGFWAVSIPGVAEFAGCIGLKPVVFDAHFTPAVEIGWRLAFNYWGKGYAVEGARAALRYGFTTLHLKEIVSYTSEQNIRSQKVMERIGMTHDPKDDFDHPKLEKGHPLRRHVLYRITREQWERL